MAIPPEFWIALGSAVTTIVTAMVLGARWVAGFLTRQQEVITDHIKDSNKTLIEVRDAIRSDSEATKGLGKDISKLADCIKNHGCGG